MGLLKLLQLAHPEPIAGELQEELALIATMRDVPDVIGQKVTIRTWRAHLPVMTAFSRKTRLLNLPGVAILA
jgi:hypothetical protein